MPVDRTAFQLQAEPNGVPSMQGTGSGWGRMSLSEAFRLQDGFSCKGWVWMEPPGPSSGILLVPLPRSSLKLAPKAPMREAALLDRSHLLPPSLWEPNHLGRGRSGRGGTLPGGLKDSPKVMSGVGGRAGKSAARPPVRPLQASRGRGRKVLVPWRLCRSTGPERRLCRGSRQLCGGQVWGMNLMQPRVSRFIRQQRWGRSRPSPGSKPGLGSS